MNNDLEILRETIGLVFHRQPNVQLFPENFPLRSFKLAMDAQPGLITESNAGIPAWMTNFFDPRIIKVLTAPLKAAEIVGNERKMGDRTTKTAQFLTVEATGHVASYDDYSENGRAGANWNYPERRSYTYQTMTQWGELQLEIAGEGRIDLSTQINNASVLVLNFYQNKTYFFGVADVDDNYGLLNDPALYSAIAPATVGGNIHWSDKAADAIADDVRLLYKQIIVQNSNNLDINEDTKLVLALSASAATNLLKTNLYNVNVKDILKKNFPNLRIVTAPQYSTAAGELVTMMVEEYEGQVTAECAFTEKLRTHPIILGHSSFSQKKSQGTWGTVIYRPGLIASMLGV